ncbi:MAG: ABC transporter permease [Deltaproteobacteria bacterium]|nr:ABC transporter permease [Deltaproteobacteria bacterium]
MNDLRLGWRNLWRNPTRTIISATAITLSFAALLTTFGVSDASYDQMLDAAVKTAGGSVLVHARGWHRSRAGDLLLEEPARIAAIAHELPFVRHTIPRIIVQGLLSSPSGAASVRLLGVDAKAETPLLDLAPFVAEGSFLAARDADPLVVGHKLAAKLGLELGDRAVITCADPKGELARALFHVSGILRPNSGLDEGVAFTSLPAAAQVVNAGRRRTEIGLVLTDDARRDEVARALRAELQHSRSPVEVLTWDQALPELLGAIRADKSFAWLFGLVVFVIMAFGIANTFLMSVLERVRELGLLSALGVTPARTARLVFAETAVLTLFSVALGYLIALSLHFYLSRWGIDLAGLSGMEVEMAGVMVQDLRLRSVIDPVRWVAGGAGVVAIVVLSACYPALRAARLDPVQAMRTYE